FYDVNRFSPVPGNIPPRSPRRLNGPSLDQEIPSSPPALPRGETHDAYPGNNDDGFLTKDKGLIRRPPRISSLFAGFENVSSDDADDFADADMSDNDYRTPLSAPNPQSGTNRASKHRALGPTSVPENLELSEVSKSTPGKSSMKRSNQYDEYGDYGSAEVPSDSQRASMKPLRQLDKPLTLVTNNKPNAMRRAALIQSGVAAHQGLALDARLSVPALRVMEIEAQPGGGELVGVTTEQTASEKFALQRLFPEAAEVIDAMVVDLLHPCRRQPKLPKALHYHRCLAMRSQLHANTTNTSNTGSGSVGSTNQATSVVDAIAQTMVGEWMFKYVRRRKSFGVADANGTEGDNVNGVRHKRWVWLAPYERAVMWSSKQPTSGSALMGKTGRKHVKDDNTPPKGSGPIFNRSILILTPARALKFTAVSAERHYVWLTALSFLAHSSQAVPEIVQAPLPAPQPVIPNFEVPQGGARLRRNGIRDSIRVAKGKTSTARSGPTSVHSSQYGGTNHSIREVESIHSSRTDPIPMAADPPFVPRFSERGSHGPPLSHNRKRSNTGSRIPPPLSFRGFSSPTGTGGHAPTSSTAGMSVGTNGSSDIYQSQPASSVSAGYTGMSVSGRSSVRTSDASNRPVNNFFDAVGTMRMEAFISPMASRFDEFPKEQEQVDMMGMHHRRGSRERRRRSRNRDSYYSNRGRPSDDWHSGSKTAGEEEYGHFDSGFSHDPFRGF
ncbi:Anucleate primary sterigmata protein A, partial [Lachnellula willkommii]